MTSTPTDAPQPQSGQPSSDSDASVVAAQDSAALAEDVSTQSGGAQLIEAAESAAALARTDDAPLGQPGRR